MGKQVLYAIISAGDAMGGSRDSITIVSEEVARAYQNDGWSRAVQLKVKDL